MPTGLAGMESELLDPRLTEQRNPRTVEIDSASPLEVVDLINAEDQSVPDAVLAERESIARAIEIATECLRRGGRLIYVGAGTSGRLGVLDATECPPTFGADPEMVQGIIAGGYAALTRSQEGAEDRADEGAAAIDEREVSADDFVFGIATSSTTPFVHRALERGAQRGARTGFLCCTEPGDDLRELVDVCIVPLVGPEVIAGSTRMKAGTATKLVLNTITTGTMIRLAKVYQNLMVDLQATSEKLVDRGQRIVMALTGCGREEARQAIESAGGSVKAAILIQKAGVGRQLAELMLCEAKGFLRSALELAEAADQAGVVIPSASPAPNPFALYPEAPPDEGCRDRLLAVLRSLPRRASELVDSLPDERLRERPGADKWCCKEQIDHLIDVDRVTAERVQAILEEDDPVLGVRDDAVENRRTLEGEARDAPARDLLRRLTDGRSALLSRVDAGPLSDFARSGRHQVHGRITLHQLLRNLARHDDHHLQAIRRLVAD